MNKLVTKGYPTLKEIALSVEPDEDVEDIIADMWATMYAHKGIGLAANQIAVLKRIIVLDVRGFKKCIINPVITKYSDRFTNDKEGCLSYPGKLVPMCRHKLITVEGLSPSGKKLKFKLRDLAGRCVQHEIDHLDGVTIA